MKLEVESTKQLQSVLMENDTVVVMLTQPRTCVPCRRLKPHLEVVSQNLPEVVFAVVDLDAVPESMVHFDVQSVPTVMLYRHGEHVKNLKERTAVKLLSEITDA